MPLYMLQEIPVVLQNATALTELWEAQKCRILEPSIGKKSKPNFKADWA